MDSGIDENRSRKITNIADKRFDFLTMIKTSPYWNDLINVKV
jgi:hypothetical protein